MVTSSPPAFTFAVTLPDQSATAIAALAQRAEDAGFGHVWLFDSPLMDRDPYPLLAAIALGTSRIRFGTCVTNPSTRDPTVTAAALATLAEMSGGRVDLGIGRGDSALRLLGRPPASLESVADAAVLVRDLVEGRAAIGPSGTSLRLAYAPAHRLPVWIAGYGPRALALAARLADGVVIQVADPNLVAWFVERLHGFAREVGRDPERIRVMVAAAATIGDDRLALDRVRWFPALVANHVADLLRRQPRSALPVALTDYLDSRPTDGYIAQRTGEYEFIDDDAVRRMAIVGNGPAHRRRADELRAAGAHQVNLYLERGTEAETIDAYADEVMTGSSAQ
jgi:probable F420-dependent oxidoreductase